MNSHLNKSLNQTSPDEQFWTISQPNVMKLFSSSLFSQQYLNKGIASFLIGFHLLQTIALFIETSFYTFPLDQSGLKPFLTQVCNILLWRNIISIHNMDVLQILLLGSTIAYLLIANCTITIILKYGKLANSWIASHWKNLVQIHFYYFFLPIHNLLTETIIQALQPGSNDVWWIAVILCLAELLNIGLCILQFISSVNIKSADPFCLLNEYFCEFSCFERAFISLMNLLVIHQTIINVPSLAMNLINLALILVHMLLLLYTLPFYSMSVLRCFIFEAGAIFTLTLSNLVFSPISDSITDHQEYILLASLVLAILFFQAAINYVQSSISKTLMTVLDYISSNNTKKTVNKFWFIQSIYHLKSLLEMNFYKPPEYCRYLESLLKNYGLIHHLNNFFSQMKIESTPTQFTSQNVHEILFKVMELWRRNNRKEYRLKLVFADLMTDNLDLKLHEPYYISKELLSQHDLKLNTKLSALSIQDRIQKFVKNSQDQLSSRLNLSVFFERIDLWFNLKQKIALQIGESMNLFHQIQHKNPELSSFINLGRKIRTYRSDVEKFYQHIPQKLLNSNLRMMLIYSIYKIKINFEYKEGRACFEKFKNLSQKKSELDNKDEITEETLLNSDNAVFIVETSKKDFGKIVFCSKNTKQIFGEQSTNLIGKHMEVLMPPFFQRIHNSLVMKKLEATGSSLKTSFFQTFARNSQGFIFPVNIVSSLFPSVEKGLFLTSIVRPIKTKLDYILLDEDGYIDSYSENLQYKLDLPLAMSERCIHILELCANINSESQSSFKACMNKMTTCCIGRKKSSSDASQTEGVSYFCSYNNSKADKMSKSRKGEEEMFKMKWTVETKTYEDKKLRVLILEEVLSQSEQQAKKQTVIKTLEEKEIDQECVFPDEKVAETDNVLVPNFTQILSPSSSLCKGLLSYQDSTKVIFKQSFPWSSPTHTITSPCAKFDDSVHNGKDDFCLTETPRIPVGMTISGVKDNYASSQSLTNNGLYMTRKVFRSTRHFSSKSEYNHKELSVTDIELEDAKVKEKVEVKASIHSKSYKNEITKSSDFQASIPSLRFYKFWQAKVPFICLMLSLILLIISSIFVLTVATDTIPVIESNFSTLRTSLNRLITLSKINMNFTSLLFVKLILLCDFCIPVMQTMLLPDVITFTESNLEIGQSLSSFSLNFTDFTFDRNIRIYSSDDSDYQLFSSLEAANMIADKALHISQATDVSSAQFAADLNFLAVNMFNDLLSHFQDEATLINNEIVERIDNAQSTSKNIFTVTSIFCGLTILVLLIIYLKSYLDTKMFLETFMYFDQTNVDKIQDQMKSFKKSLDSDFEDLHSDLRLNTDYASSVKRKNAHDKVPKTQGLIFAIFKRALVLLVFLVVPILITRISDNTFKSNFESIAPNLFSIIKPKQVISQALLALTMAGFYNVKKDVLVMGQNIGDAVEETIKNLPNLVSEDSLLTINKNYDLFHQDYCQFVSPDNYITCESLFNGVSSTGIAGMVLTLQANLITFKKAADLYQAYTEDFSYLVQNSFFMITFANDATNFVQTENVDEFMTDMSQIKQNIVIFIIVSFIVCLVLSILGARYVYLASSRERKDICKLMQVFPVEVVVRNQRLKLFLIKDSRKLREVIQRFKQL